MPSLTVVDEAFAASAVTAPWGRGARFAQRIAPYVTEIPGATEPSSPIGTTVSAPDDVLLVFARAIGSIEKPAWRLLGIKDTVPPSIASRLRRAATIAGQGINEARRLPIADARPLSKHMDLRDPDAGHITVQLGREFFIKKWGNSTLDLYPDAVVAWWSNKSEGEVTIASHRTVSQHQSQVIALLTRAHKDLSAVERHTGQMLESSEGLPILSRSRISSRPDAKRIRAKRQLLPVPAMRENPRGRCIIASQFIDDPALVWAEPRSTIRGVKAWVLYGVERRHISHDQQTDSAPLQGLDQFDANLPELEKGIRVFV